MSLLHSCNFYGGGSALFCQDFKAHAGMHKESVCGSSQCVKFRCEKCSYEEKSVSERGRLHDVLEVAWDTCPKHALASAGLESTKADSQVKIIRRRNHEWTHREHGLHATLQPGLKCLLAPSASQGVQLCHRPVLFFLQRQKEQICGRSTVPAA